MSGEKALKAVWALCEQHVKLRDSAASSAKAKALRAKQKAVKATEVVPAIEAFLARHGERLQVRRGKATKLPATVKVHPLHRALVAHFGFLEIRVSPTVWPETSHADGLCITGRSDDPWCDVKALGALHTKHQKLRVKQAYDPKDKKEAAKLAPLVPMLTTLAGLNGAWVAGPRAVAVSGFAPDRSDSDIAGVAEPRFGLPYAVLARLRFLEQRLHNADLARAFAARCQAFAAVDLEPSGGFVLRSDPRVHVWPPKQNLESGYHPSVSTVLECIPEGRDGFKTDAAQQARAEALEARLSLTGWAATIQHSGQTMKAEYPLSATPSDAKLAYGLGVLPHLHRMLKDPALPEFDEVPGTFTPEVLALLEQTGTSAKALAGTPGLVVEAVGRVLPRARWRIDADATQDTSFWRAQGTTKVASAAFEDLSPAWLERLSRSLGRGAAAADGQSAVERHREAACVLAITQQLATLETPGKPTWRDLAASKVLSSKDFADAHRNHVRWLRDRPAGPIRLTSRRWLDFNFAMLLGADPHADVLQLDLSRSDLRALDFTDLDLGGAKLVHVLAAQVKFVRAAMSSSMGIDSDYRGADFSGADLRGADFSRSDFTGAKFNGADCTGTDFEHCDLTGCDFTDAKLEGVKLKGATSPPKT